MSTKQTVLLAAAALAASASAIRSLIDNAHAQAIPFTHEKLAEHVADFADDASAFVDALSAIVPDDHPDEAAPAIALTTPGPAL